MAYKGKRDEHMQIHPSLGIWHYRRPINFPSNRSSPSGSLPVNTASEQRVVRQTGLVRRVASQKGTLASARQLYALKPSLYGSSPNLALGARITGLGLTPMESTPQFTVKIASKSAIGSLGGIPKPQNQDSFFTLAHNDYHFLGVCDGHGLYGHFVSDYLKTSLPRLVLDQIERKEMEEALKSGYEMTVMGLRSTGIDCSNSGSTCVTVLWKGNSLVCGNVGDSRAVLGKRINGNWAYTDLSSDHKPELPLEKARIEASGGEVTVSKFTNAGPPRVYIRNEGFPGLAMSRSIGDEVAKTVGVTAEPDIRRHTISRDDKFMILASDGVWEFISSLEAVKIVAVHWELGQPVKACNALLRAAQMRWHVCDSMVDDITVVLAFLNA